MPYKDPEKRRAYAREYQKSYQPAWRAKHPTYNRDYLEKRFAENPELRVKYNAARTKESNVARSVLYQARNPLKVKARRKLQYEVKMGRIVRPDNCSNCGSTNKIEGDHHDYTKPLDVTWLCKTCHSAVGKARIRAAQAAN